MFFYLFCMSLTEALYYLRCTILHFKQQIYMSCFQNNLILDKKPRCLFSFQKLNTLKKNLLCNIKCCCPHCFRKLLIYIILTHLKNERTLPTHHDMTTEYYHKHSMFINKVRKINTPHILKQKQFNLLSCHYFCVMMPFRPTLRSM